VKPAGKPIFSALKDLNVSVRHFQSNPQEVLLLIDKEKCERVSDKFKQNEIPFERIDDVALLSLVGEGVSQCSEILPEFWQTLQDKGSSIFMISSNSMSVSAVVKKSELNPLAETLHSKFTSLGFLK
jgi:aspartokinase